MRQPLTLVSKQKGGIQIELCIRTPYERSNILIILINPQHRDKVFAINSMMLYICEWV